MYRVSRSLLVHRASPSQMNALNRLKETLLTEDYVDGRQRCRQLSFSRLPFTGGMAASKHRENQLASVVGSLRGQLDLLYVYLNEGFAAVPGVLREPWIVPLLHHQHGGDRGDAGKFYATPAAPAGYYFSVDDDILYPSDYAATMAVWMQHHGDKAVLGVHARVLRHKGDPVYDFYGDTASIHFTAAVAHDMAVDFVGTGTAVMHTSHVKLCPRIFQARNVADLYVGLLARAQGVPLRAVPRREMWLQPLGTVDDRSIYNDLHKNNIDVIGEVMDASRGLLGASA